jgi:hypothetical protein
VESGGQADVPSLTNTELVHLRVRVIAFENLIIALLAQATDHQLELVREMASYISPRPGFTPHPLTIHAAVHMNNLVERARQSAVREDAKRASQSSFSLSPLHPRIEGVDQFVVAHSLPVQRH